MSHGPGLLIMFTGPVSVSIINAMACWLLWSKHHDLLFRDGPPPPGLETHGSALSDPIRTASIFGTVLALGPLIFGLFLLGDHLLIPPRISGPVSLRWSYLTGNYASSPAVADGTVYLGSDRPQGLRAERRHRPLRWSDTTGNGIHAGPAVYGGTVYVGSDDGKLYALNAATGRLRWSYTTGLPHRAPARVANGTVYFGGVDHKVYALSAATGRLRWSYTTRRTPSPPVRRWRAAPSTSAASTTRCTP